MVGFFINRLETLLILKLARSAQRSDTGPLRNWVYDNKLSRTRNPARAGAQSVCDSPPRQRSSAAISSTDALLLVRSTHLASSLAELSKSSSNLSTQIPPEIIEYVDEGRNPDIYTREFVELVQRGNQELKAKSEAFASFRDILGEELAAAMPELRDDVSRILSGGPVAQVKMENHKVKGG